MPSFFWKDCRPEACTTFTAATPIQEIAFVDSQLCADCHEEQHRKWKGSHHDLAMQLATADTVLGDFNDSNFTHFGVTTRFYQKNGGFYVHTEGPDGRLSEYEIRFRPAAVSHGGLGHSRPALVPPLSQGTEQGPTPRLARMEAEIRRILEAH